MVGQRCQSNKLPGVLHDFTDGGFARTMDASSPAYGVASAYRRNVIMVDTEDGQSYLVDFFNVFARIRHDYILHGPPGKANFLDEEWSEVSLEDFAGPNIETKPEFQHFFNIRQLKTGQGVLEYRHVRDENARLRIFPLTPDDREIFIADAYDLPRAKKHLVKFIICTRKSDDKDTPFKSAFVSVWEPYKGDNQILTETRLVKLDQGEGHAVVVDRGDLTDLIIYDPSGSTKKLEHYDLETDAAGTVVTFDRSGELTRVFFSDGSHLQCGGKKFTADPISGKVVSIDALQRTFQVELESPGEISETAIPGRVAHFINEIGTTEHPLLSANVSGKLMNVKIKDDFLIGYFRVQKSEENILTPDNNFMPFVQHYPGATILDGNYRPSAVITGMNNGFALKEPAAVPFNPGDEAWICNVGIGDQFLLKPVFSWERASN